MTAFAANSLLCRAALAPERIDPVTFTAVRIVSGSVALALPGLMGHRGPLPGSWRSAFALFAYAIAFSLAYTRISAGIGALLLFGAVQVSMIGHALGKGARLLPGEWLGVMVALAGLVVLTRPGLRAPDPGGTLLMVIAGVAWGVYTIRGRGHDDPLRVTAGNFVRSAALAALASACLLPWSAVRWSSAGLLLAAASGMLASGAGYAIWYAALRGLAPLRAAVVQLSAPLLAAIGGVVLLAEPLTARLAMATPLVLGGIALAVLVKGRTQAPGGPARPTRGVTAA
jgi:drug/metabolite transporter (DMT)-like permease